MRKDAQKTRLVRSPYRRLLPAAAAIVSLLAGCTRPPTTPLVSPYPTPRSIVVLPLLNQSPSDKFDLIATTDTLVAELSQVDGLVVLPTNRSLKLLLARGQTHPTSVADAIGVARQLGADGALIGAITEYKPYPPQRIGMVLQLYWVRADMSRESIDPTRLSRRASAADGGYYSGAGSASQVQAVIDASRNDVTKKVWDYARGHEGQDSPFGWRKYLMDTDAYMHFVCHEMIVRLLDQELSRITEPVGTQQRRMGAREHANDIVD